MNAHRLNSTVALIAIVATCACRGETSWQPSPLGKIDGFKLVQLAGSCEQPLAFQHVCGGDPWTSACAEKFHSVQRNDGFERTTEKGHAWATSASRRIDCHDWSMWTDDYGRIVGLCALESHDPTTDTVSESSDAKLKRLASRIFGKNASAELDKFSAEWLTHTGTWAGVEWWGWTKPVSFIRDHEYVDWPSGLRCVEFALRK